jgi:hypothetical protein
MNEDDPANWRLEIADEPITLYSELRQPVEYSQPVRLASRLGYQNTRSTG